MGKTDWNVSKLKKAARAIFKAGLHAVDPEKAVLRNIQLRHGKLKVGTHLYDLRRIERIFVVGGGKAGAPMARALERLLGNRISGGMVVVKFGHGARLRKIGLLEAGHPVPDERGERGAKKILEILKGVTSKDLVICVLSGGGSALLPLPVPGVSLKDKQRVTQHLLECGATIQEMNAIRKHLSQMKGGQLARSAFPASVLTLALSDVVGDSPDVIASGPTVPDLTSYSMCQDILKKYNLWEKLPFSIQTVFQKGVRGAIKETPKPHDPIFKRSQFHLVGNNRLALEVSKKEAKRYGFHPLILSSTIEGESRDVAKVHVAIVKEILQSRQPVRSPACLISGGETTVTIRGKGLGGRNLEFALAAALGLEGLNGVLGLSAGTDGTDGPTDAAGAFVDGKTASRARRFGMDPAQFLSENNAYPLFKRLGDLLITGPTQTNVMDVRLFLVAP